MKKIVLSIVAVALISSGCLFYGQLEIGRKAAEAASAAEVADETARLAAERLKAVTVKALKPIREFQRPAPLPLEPRQNILNWMELNPDTIGYLKIEGTKIDYPVVQGADNDYYLNYTFDHIKATRGSIFLDANVVYDPSDLPRHMLIHGHHMRNGTMFQNIAKFKEEKFFYDHPFVLFETLYQDTVWQVFSVYVCNATEYVPMAFKDDEAYVAYLQKTADRSMYPVDVSLAAGDIIMTLNTCSYEFKGAHTLVAAKLAWAYND